MRKIYLILLLVIFGVGYSHAQNANRSGIFLEAGASVLTGKSPIIKADWVNNTLTGYRGSGPDINFALGYRLAISSNFAIELKAEAASQPKYFTENFIFSAMPGFRYTTDELFGNTSVYIGMNAGFAIGHHLDEYVYDLYLDDTRELGVCSFGSLGAKISLSGGFNFTPSFYTGLYYDLNILTDQVTSLKIKDHYFDQKLAMWGAIGIRLGYRF